jgi:hypothetical protein
MMPDIVRCGTFDGGTPSASRFDIQIYIYQVDAAIKVELDNDSPDQAPSDNS